MIAKLQKVTILTTHKEALLTRLQEFGKTHIVNLNAQDVDAKLSSSKERQQVLKFLLSAPYKRKQVHNIKHFDILKFQNETLKVRELLKRYKDDVEHLQHRIATIKKWGVFDFEAVSYKEDFRLWFYRVPLNKIDVLREQELIFSEIKRDNKFRYIVVIAKEKPMTIPFVRDHLGSEPLDVLEDRLEKLENTIEDLEAKRIKSTRYIDIYINSLYQIEDRENLEIAKRYSFDNAFISITQCWVDQSDKEAFKEALEGLDCALLMESPTKEQMPPTLIKNTPLFSFGEKLITFYRVPSYWQSDLSVTFFLSFSLFFAMIIGDAGYGLVTFVIYLLVSKSSPISNLLASISIFTTIWGVLVGGYFGINLPEDSVLNALKLFDVNDYDSMMQVSILMGALHIIFANSLKAYDSVRLELPSSPLVPIGWNIAIVAGLIYYLFGLFGLSMGLLGAGALLVVLFSSEDASIVKRLLMGIKSLLSITSLFGDILSYLRLFALGLASTAMAISFNDLATSVKDEHSGIGILAFALILLIGHGLNFMLGVMSGVVHGLRLNVIEFLNWNSDSEGYSFKAFRKKGDKKWNT